MLNIIFFHIEPIAWSYPHYYHMIMRGGGGGGYRSRGGPRWLPLISKHHYMIYIGRRESWPCTHNVTHYFIKSTKPLLHFRHRPAFYTCMYS